MTELAGLDLAELSRKANATIIVKSLPMTRRRSGATPGPDYLRYEEGRQIPDASSRTTRAEILRDACSIRIESRNEAAELSVEAFVAFAPVLIDEVEQRSAGDEEVGGICAEMTITTFFGHGRHLTTVSPRVSILSDGRRARAAYCTTCRLVLVGWA